MLCGIFLLLDDDIAIDKNVIEQEELSGLQFLPAGLGEDPLTHEDSARQRERLTRRPKTLLNLGDPLSIGHAVHCNTIQVQLAHY